MAEPQFVKVRAQSENSMSRSCSVLKIRSIRGCVCRCCFSGGEAGPHNYPWTKRRALQFRQSVGGCWSQQEGDISEAAVIRWKVVRRNAMPSRKPCSIANRFSALFAFPSHGVVVAAFGHMYYQSRYDMILRVSELCCYHSERRVLARPEICSPSCSSSPSARQMLCSTCVCQDRQAEEGGENRCLSSKAILRLLPSLSSRQLYRRRRCQIGRGAQRFCK